MKRESIIVIALIAVFVALNFTFMGRNDQLRERRSVIPYSSYNSSPKGLKALYLLIKKLGHQTKRIQNPHLRNSNSAGLMFLIQPSTSFSERESERLVDWVSSGNSLIIALDEQAKIASKLGFEVVEIVETNPQNPKRRLPVAYPSHLSPLNLSIDKINAKLRAYIKAKDEKVKDFVEHFKIDEGAVLASYKLGLGKVIATCRPEIFDNINLENPDNLKLVANILNYEAKGRQIYFDEFHHGFGSQETLLDLISSTPVGWGILQILSVILLWAYGVSKRFGKPVLLKEKSSRSSVEYVNAMSNLYSNANAKSAALSILKAKFERAVKTNPSLRNRNLVDLDALKPTSTSLPDSELVELIRNISLKLNPKGINDANRPKKH